MTLVTMAQLGFIFISLTHHEMVPTEFRSSYTNISKLGPLENQIPGELSRNAEIGLSWRKLGNGK